MFITLHTSYEIARWADGSGSLARPGNSDNFLDWVNSGSAGVLSCPKEVNFTERVRNSGKIPEELKGIRAGMHIATNDSGPRPAQVVQLGLLVLFGGLVQGRAQTLNQGAFFKLVEQSRTAFTVQGDGARAMGTGGAFIAVADDSTAVSYNPAGLAQLLKSEGSLVVQGMSKDLSFTGATGHRWSAPVTRLNILVGNDN
jgi:hypothetical protein